MITTGQQALASDFISASAGAGSSGQVPKLNAQGKLDNSFLSVKFGGTGADGALSVSSGTTNIDLGGVAVFVKNYSSISITGTGKITFSNPHANGTKIVFRCYGDCTLTSSSIPYIDASGMGAQAGGAQVAGTNAIPDVLDELSHHGGTASMATAGVAYSGLQLYTRYITDLLRRFIVTPVGSGGSGGVNGYSGAVAGVGGRGGGSIYIEVGGTLNMTGAGGISVAGKDGAQGANYSSGGGGGGAGGVGIILYNLAGTITGNINDKGGNGANGTGWDGSHGYSGAGGGGAGAGGIGGAGSTRGDNMGGGGGGGGANILNVGVNANGGGGGGSGGASTGGLIIKNDYFS